MVFVIFNQTHSFGHCVSGDSAKKIIFGVILLLQPFSNSI